jgi:DNA-binding transcriptional LysR family regulator
MFDIDLLQAFVAVIDCRGFTKAARRLNATQSTISAKIRRLEILTGKRLIERNRRGLITLSIDGEILLGYAHEILRLEEQVRQRLSEPALSGWLRLGMSDDFASGKGLTKALGNFAKRHPDIRLEVRIGNGTALLEELSAGAFDFVLTKKVGSSDQGEILWSEPLKWVCASNFRMDPKAPVRLITFPPPCNYRTIAVDALNEKGREWQIIYVSPSLSGVKTAISSGLGITPLPVSLIDADLSVVNRKFDLPPLHPVDFTLHARRHVSGGAAEELGKMLRKAHFEGS